MTVASVLIKAAVIGAGIYGTLASPQGESPAACPAGVDCAALDFNDEDDFNMLQRRARTVEGHGEEVVDLSQSGSDDAGPLWRAEEERQEVDQQAQQQEQQEQVAQAGDEVAHAVASTHEPEILKKVNAILKQKVTAKLNENLPAMIKAKGMDPVPSLLSRENLVVKDLVGLGKIEVKTFFLKSLDIGVKTSGFGGKAVFELRAKIPGTKALVSRSGMLGAEQHYALSMDDITVTVQLTGVAKLHGTQLVAEGVEPHAKVLINQVLVSGEGPVWVRNKLNEAVKEDQQTIQGKVAELLEKSLSRVFSKMMPMPLHLDLMEHAHSGSSF